MRRFLSLFLALFLASCGPTYPKQKLTESLVRLCRKEYGIEVKAQLAGTTLGVLVVIPGLLEELLRQSAANPNVPMPPVFLEGNYAQEEFHFQFLTSGSFARVKKGLPEEEKGSAPDRGEERSKALTTLDHVSTAMRRVALSTDAPLEFYTLIARDPGPAHLDVVFSGHLNDLKRVQYFDISLGELRRRSRAGVRPQPEEVARRTVLGFLQALSGEPLDRLVGRNTTSAEEFSQLFPKVLGLVLTLQGRERGLTRGKWPIRQIDREQALVYVPLTPMGEPGALLFTVRISENQGSLRDIERLPSTSLPSRYRQLGDPSQWSQGFYLEPLSMPQFLSEQIARRVLAEFEPLEAQSKERSERKPATREELTRILLETSAYVLSSYQFTDFKTLTVTDALKGTRWVVPAKELPVYRRRDSPAPQPIP